MPLSKVKARLGQPSESQRSSKLDSLRRRGGPAGRGSCLRGTAQLPGGRLVPWPGRPQTCGVRVGRWMSQSVACSRSQPGGAPGSRWVGSVMGTCQGPRGARVSRGHGSAAGRRREGPEHSFLEDSLPAGPPPPHPRSCPPPFPKCPRGHLDTQVCRLFPRSVPGRQGTLALSREQSWAMMGPALVNPACGAAEWTCWTDCQLAWGTHQLSLSDVPLWNIQAS